MRRATDADHSWIVATACQVLCSDFQAHSHRQFRVLDVNQLIAQRAGVPVGFLTWEIADRTCETLAIACTIRGRAHM
jgi:hypothetical protein